MLQPNDLSVSKLLKQPEFKGSAYFVSRTRYIQSLNQVFIKNLKYSRKAFIAVPYVDHQTKSLYFWVRVPSETYNLNKITYDCVVEIPYTEGVEIKNRTGIKIYCNSPSFIFTYCYVYNSRGLIPDFVKSRIPNEAMTIAPKTRNPYELIGFEKISWQALKYLVDGGCLQNDYIDKYHERWNTISAAALSQKIADPSILVAVYQNAKKLDSAKRSKTKKKLSTSQRKNIHDTQKRYEKIKKASNVGVIGIFSKQTPRSKITSTKASKGVTMISKKAKTKKKY